MPQVGQNYWITWYYDTYDYGRTCWTNTGVPFCTFHEYEMQYRNMEFGLYMVTQTKFMTESSRSTSPYAGWISYTLANIDYAPNAGKSWIHIISPVNAWNSYHLSARWTGYMW